MCSSCVHHVFMMCSWCVHHVFIMCSTCAHHVIIMCSSCVHHVLMMCSWCVHDVFTMFSSCVHHVFIMCSWCVYDVFLMCSWCVHHVLIMWSSWQQPRDTSHRIAMPLAVILAGQRPGRDAVLLGWPGWARFLWLVVWSKGVASCHVMVHHTWSRLCTYSVRTHSAMRKHVQWRSMMFNDV